MNVSHDYFKKFEAPLPPQPPTLTSQEILFRGILTLVVGAAIGVGVAALSHSIAWGSVAGVAAGILTIYLSGKKESPAAQFLREHKQLNEQEHALCERLRNIGNRAVVNCATPNSLLIDFYTGDGTDVFGHTFREISEAFDNQLLEDIHDYIQWVFPNRHQDNAAPATSPTLDDASIQAIREKGLVRARAMYLRFLNFLGLRIADGHQDAIVCDPQTWPHQAPNWLGVGGGYNHNYARITRVLNFLSLLGQTSSCAALFTWLAVNRHRLQFNDQSFGYWARAMPKTFWTENTDPQFWKHLNITDAELARYRAK